MDNPADSPAPLYQDSNGNLVTRSRAVIGGTTYSVANITSVRTHKKGSGRLASIPVAILAVVALVSQSWALASVLLFAAFIIYAATPASYTVIIGTSAREQDALKSNDPLVIGAIVHALNAAIDSQ